MSNLLCVYRGGCMHAVKCVDYCRAPPAADTIAKPQGSLASNPVNTSTDLVIPETNHCQEFRASVCGDKSDLVYMAQGVRDICIDATTVRALRDWLNRAFPAETSAEPTSKGLAVIRAAQLDIAAEHLDRNGILSLGTACRESAKLLRDFAVPAVKTSSPLTADPARIDAEQFPEGPK
jgi:hypothetical protein